MSDRRSEDSAQDLQKAYSNYKVYDQHYNEIGKVDDIFVDENDQPEYIGVKMGFLGLKSTVVPMELVRVNDKRGLIEVAESENVIKNGPSFDDDEVISPEHESEILRYYGLGHTSQSRDRDEPRGGYAASSPPVDLEYGGRNEFSDRPARRDEPSRSYRDEPPRERETSREPAREPAESYREESSRERETSREPAREPAESYREESSRERETSRESAREPAREVRDEDEVRVQRSEEELRAGVRRRETGGVNVRKRVRTEHEQVRIPKRREEISVERVPVEEQGSSATGGSAPGIDSGGDEIHIPIVEEEIVVEKKPVVKEEIRIRKDMVEEEEIIEADLRKEEIEVEDETRKQDRRRDR